MKHIDVRRTVCAVLLCLSATALAQNATTPFDTTGRYRVVMEEEPALPNHTVYRPADLQTLGRNRLPIVVFGNGACGNAGNAFERYLAQIASHGYLVIANGPIDAAAFGRPPKPGRPMGPFPANGPPPSQSTTSQLIDAITWAQAQADAPGPYQGRIDRTHVAVSGQSCGGLQALAAAADPRVTTALILNSGVIRTMPHIVLPPGVKPPTLANLPKPDLKKLHTPILYIIGGPTDIAYDNANGDFNEITAVPVYRLDTDTGHNGTYWQPHGGRFADAAIAWLDWQMKGSVPAGRKFSGPDCAFCRDPHWKLRRKNITR